MNAIKRLTEIVLSEPDRSPEAMEVRNAIWPEGAPFYEGPQLEDVLSTFEPQDVAFFDEQNWSALDAIWMLSTGEAPCDQPSSDRKSFEEMLADEAAQADEQEREWMETDDSFEWGESSDDRFVGRPESKALSPSPARRKVLDRIRKKYNRWLVAHSVMFAGRAPVVDMSIRPMLLPLADTDAAKYLYPLNVHGWIRWATQFKLPVHRRFWEAHNAWRCARWQHGRQVAWLCWRDGDSAVPIRCAPIPSESTWHIPLAFEYEASLQLGVQVNFVHHWKVVAQEVFEVAKGVRTRWGRVPNVIRRLSPKERQRTVGGRLFQRIRAAVDALASERGLVADEGGRYVFGLTQAELIAELRRIDPMLSERADRTISAALPALAHGKPQTGRPRVSAREPRGR
ncbi:MAG TPA: hypothetical protein VF453_18515 [Burkholderiaceae bacterium]